MASLHKNRRTTLERIDKFISPLYFSDVNLHSRLYDKRRSIGRYRVFLLQTKLFAKFLHLHILLFFIFFKLIFPFLFCFVFYYR